MTVEKAGDVVTGRYLWPLNQFPFPDGVTLKDASDVSGRGGKMESYGRNSVHYQQMEEAQARIAQLEREIERLREGA